MDVMTVKDANDKEFSIDVSKIFDINGDYLPNTEIKDQTLKNRISFEHDTKIVDASGKEIDTNKLINDMNSGNTNVVAVDVETEATHSGKNHNYCIYYEDSMESDCESFMNPFHKPMLKNHDSYSEPLGRVIETNHGPSALTDERTAIHLKVRVTDQDAIPKFIDKRYGTVSIGGSMGTVTCNICGKTILKDGKFRFCGHMRGETYKDQICYWGAKDIEYHEVSVVNNPADDFAQITKVTVLTDKDIQKNNDKEESSMNGTEDAKVNVDDVIDATLGSKVAEVQDANQQEEPKVEDNVNDADAKSVEDNKPSDGNTETEDSKTEADVQDANQDTNSEDSKPAEENAIQDSKELEDALGKVKYLEDELLDAQTQVKALEQSLEDAKAENATLKDRCITLATANKEYVVDGIISKESFKDDEAKDNRKKDLMVKSMKELKTIISESQNKTRDLASIDNPCLAVDQQEKKESNSNKADTDIKDSVVTSVDDAAQQIISSIFKNN